MKNLLLAIQEELRREFADQIREGDIYISPHHSFIPASVRQPCIGIKDGDIIRTEKPGCVQTEYNVSVICWKELLKKEGSLVGSAQETGIFEFAEAVRTCLENNLLTASDMEIMAAWCKAENATDIWQSDRAMLIRKKLDFVFERNISAD